MDLGSFTGYVVVKENYDIAQTEETPHVLVVCSNGYLEPVSRELFPKLACTRSTGAWLRFSTWSRWRASLECATVAGAGVRWRDRVALARAFIAKAGLGLSDNAGVDGPDSLLPCVAPVVRVVEGGRDTERRNVFPRLFSLQSSTHPLAWADSFRLGESRLIRPAATDDQQQIQFEVRSVRRFRLIRAPELASRLGDPAGLSRGEGRAVFHTLE